MDVILIAGHSSIIDQPKIELNGPNYVATYGEVGECNLTSDFVSLERAFFGNQLPRNIDERNVDDFKRIMQSFILNKKFKLQNKMYHDMEITLCIECFVDEYGEKCDEKDASQVIILASGVFRMGDTSPRIVENYYVLINPDESTLIQSNGKIKKFMISRTDANTIYKDSVFPNKAMLDEIYSKNKNLTPRSTIPLKELISKTKFTLSDIISRFNQDQPKIFIVKGCRALDYDANLGARLASSDSEKSSEQSNESDEVVVDQPFLEYEPPLKSAQLPKVNDKVFKKKIRIKIIKQKSAKKGSRIQKDVFDSLLLEPKTKGPRAKGKVDSLMSLGKNAAGKKTRKKRKNKRK